MNDVKNNYKNAGVDVEAGYQSVELIKEYVKKTKTAGVIGGIGGFGGLFKPDLKGFSNPVFVSGTDGVGTKLKLAFLMDKHDTIGIDCVAMCVNDIICSGASPLFFLDYIACGKNYPEKIASIVKGISDGCLEAGAALIGGETAEHPDLMAKDEYDLAGFSVGIVDKDKMITNDNQKEGDIIIALPSTGIHSNGFSLIRKVFDIENVDLGNDYGILSHSLGDTLLTPTAIYVKPVLSLIKKVNVKSISHITGGGFYENIPRSVKNGLSAIIEKKTIKIPPIFDLIKNIGDLSEAEMFGTFNMGVGLTIIVNKEDEYNTLTILKENKVDGYVLGSLKKGEEKIKIV